MDELLNKDLIEGDEAAQRFDSLVSKVMSVPKTELLRRQAEHRSKSELNGNKRGPKPKPPASIPALDAEPLA